MPFTKREMIELRRIMTLVLIASSMVSANVDCGGKAFHCVNATHFMICVDLGGGVTSTIDSFIIPCPLSTECRRTNRYECEFPKPVILEKIETSVPDVNVLPAVPTTSAKSTEGSSNAAEFSQYVTGNPSMTELTKVTNVTHIAKSDPLEESIVNAPSTTEYFHSSLNNNINIKNESENNQISTNTDMPNKTEFSKASTNTSILNKSFQNVVDTNLSSINDLKKTTTYIDINTTTNHWDYTEISTDTNLPNKTDIIMKSPLKPPEANILNTIQESQTSTDPNHILKTEILETATATIITTKPDHFQTTTDNNVPYKMKLYNDPIDAYTKNDLYLNLKTVVMPQFDISSNSSEIMTSTTELFPSTTDTNVPNSTQINQDLIDAYNKSELFVDLKEAEMPQSEISQKSSGISITSTTELFPSTTDTDVPNTTQINQDLIDAYNKSELFVDLKEAEMSQSEHFRKSSGLNITSTTELFPSTTDINVPNTTQINQDLIDAYNKSELFVDIKEAEIYQKSSGINITSTTELLPTITFGRNNYTALTNNESYNFLFDTTTNIDFSEIATDSSLNITDNFEELYTVTTPRTSEYFETTTNTRVTSEAKVDQYLIDFTADNNIEPIEMALSTNISAITDIKSTGVSVLSTTEYFQSSGDTNLPYDNKFSQQNEKINREKLFQTLAEFNPLEYSTTEVIKTSTEVNATQSSIAKTIWNENNVPVTKQFPLQDLDNVSVTSKKVSDQTEESTKTNINVVDIINQPGIVTENILNRELNLMTTMSGGISEYEAAMNTALQSFHKDKDDNLISNISNKVEMPLNINATDAFYTVPYDDRIIYTTEKQFSTFTPEITTENIVVTELNLNNDGISDFHKANIFTSLSTTESDDVTNIEKVNVSGDLTLEVISNSKDNAALTTTYSNLYATEPSLTTSNHNEHNFSSTISYSTVTPYTYNDVTKIGQFVNIVEKSPVSNDNYNLKADVSIKLKLKNESLYKTRSYENQTTKLNDSVNTETSGNFILNTNLEKPTTKLELESTTKDLLKTNSNTSDYYLNDRHDALNLTYKSINELDIKSKFNQQISSTSSNTFYVNTTLNTQVTTKNPEYIEKNYDTTLIGEASDFKTNLNNLENVTVTDRTQPLNTETPNYQTLRGTTDKSDNLLLRQNYFIKYFTEKAENVDQGVVTELNMLQNRTIKRDFDEMVTDNVVITRVPEESEIKKAESRQDLVDMQIKTEKLTSEKKGNNFLGHIHQVTSNFSMSGFQTKIEKSGNENKGVPLSIVVTTLSPPFADLKQGVNISETKTYSGVQTNKTRNNIFDILYSLAENKSNSQSAGNQLSIANASLNSTQSLQRNTNMELENNILFNASYNIQLNSQQINNNKHDADKAVNTSDSSHFNMNRNTTLANMNQVSYKATSKTYIDDVHSKKTTIVHIKPNTANNDSDIIVPTAMSITQSEQNIPSITSLGITRKQHGNESLAFAKRPEQQRAVFENHRSNITLSSIIVNASFNSKLHTIPLNKNLTGSKNYYQLSIRGSRFNIASVGNVSKIPKPSQQVTRNNYDTIRRNNSHIPVKPQSNVGKLHFNCSNKNRGRYSDTEDCNIFYICIGKLEPIIGRCPAHTVFSDIRKQCTKNISHCIRGNEFKCSKPGRYIDILKRNVYYICVKKREKYLKFKFQCLNGYYLNETLVRCVIEPQSESQSSLSFDSNGDVNNNNNGDVSNNNNENTHKTNKREHSSRSQNEFNCGKEGKFADEDDCNKYYVCTKNKKLEFRRRKKKCESDEVFHKEKKSCVDADSYEC